MLLFKVI